jgi:hypothetical protein
MGLEAELQRIRSDFGAANAELVERLEKRIALLELRVLQLNQRLRLLEAHWGKNPENGLDESLGHGLERSRVRRAKIPPRPRLMRERGDGVDPPLGDAEWLLMQ